jgi:hypothetical protein
MDADIADPFSIQIVDQNGIPDPNAVFTTDFGAVPFNTPEPSTALLILAAGCLIPFFTGKAILNRLRR